MHQRQMLQLFESEENTGTFQDLLEYYLNVQDIAHMLEQLPDSTECNIYRDILLHFEERATGRNESTTRHEIRFLGHLRTLAGELEHNEYHFNYLLQWLMNMKS